MDEIKEIYAETVRRGSKRACNSMIYIPQGEEAKMLAKWMKPDKAGA